MMNCTSLATTSGWNQYGLASGCEPSNMLEGINHTVEFGLYGLGMHFRCQVARQNANTLCLDMLHPVSVPKVLSVHGGMRSL